jgi:hypothetical protein
VSPAFFFASSSFALWRWYCCVAALPCCWYTSKAGNNYNTAADFKMEILCMHGDTNVDRFQYSHLLLTSLIQCLFLIAPKSKKCSPTLISWQLYDV